MGKNKTVTRCWVDVVTRDYPVKSVTCLMGWFRDMLCHVVVGQRVADVFGVIGGRVVKVDIEVA